MSQQKAKARGGAGGGPSNKAAAAGSSCGEASTSRGEGSRSSTLPSASAGHRSTAEDAAQPALPSAEAASGAQQTQPQPAGGGKKEKERQRKERQRQRRMDEAKEALQVAIEAMLDARCVSPLWLRCIGRFPGEVVASMCGWQGALTCGGACGCRGGGGRGSGGWKRRSRERLLGDVGGREVREPCVVEVHRQVSWGGGGVYVRVAGCSRVAVRVAAAGRAR